MIRPPTYWCNGWPSLDPFTQPLFSKLVLRTFLSRSLIHFTLELAILLSKLVSYSLFSEHFWNFLNSAHRWPWGQERAGNSKGPCAIFKFSSSWSKQKFGAGLWRLGVVRVKNYHEFPVVTQRWRVPSRSGSKKKVQSVTVTPISAHPRQEGSFWDLIEGSWRALVWNFCIFCCLERDWA